MLKAAAGLPAVAFLNIRYLFKHHLFVDNLGGLVADVIHSTNPRHWVGGFELFSYTFFFGEFFYQSRKEGLCFFIYIGEVGIEFAGSEQIVVNHFMVLL